MNGRKITSSQWWNGLLTTINEFNMYFVCPAYTDQALSYMCPVSSVSAAYHKSAYKVTENAQSDTFKAPCCCFENAPNNALTIVCTINVSIDCNWFDVPNLPQKKNILK